MLENALLDLGLTLMNLFWTYKVVSIFGMLENALLDLGLTLMNLFWTYKVVSIFGMLENALLDLDQGSVLGMQASCLCKLLSNHSFINKIDTSKALCQFKTTKTLTQDLINMI